MIYLINCGLMSGESLRMAMRAFTRSSFVSFALALMSAQDAWSSTLLHTSSVSDSSVPLCRFTAASNAFCAICTFLSKDEQMFSNFAGNVQGVGQTKISQFKEDFLPPPASFWRRHSN